MVQVGLVSYAWYLWHWPALSIVRILAVGPPRLVSGLYDLSLDACLVIFDAVLVRAAAALPYRPQRAGQVGGLRRLRRHSRGSRPRLRCRRLGPSGSANRRRKSPSLPPRETSKRNACSRWSRMRQRVPGRTVLLQAICRGSCLWGDSVADRLSPALHEWASQRGGVIAVEELTKAACPPLLNALPPKSAMSKPYYECRSFNSWVADRLALAGAVGGSGVLLSATWWPRATDLDLRPFGSTAPRLTFDISATTTEESLSILESAMRSTLRDIAGHGLRAVIVLQTPLLISPWGGPLYAPDCLFRRSERECAMPLAVHRQLSNKVNQILTKVAGEFSNVRVFDPTPLFCPDERCPARINGIVAYTDELHISATMARTLVSQRSGPVSRLAHRAKVAKPMKSRAPCSAETEYRFS